MHVQLGASGFFNASVTIHSLHCGIEQNRTAADPGGQIASSAQKHQAKILNTNLHTKGGQRKAL